jgi:hypothetical protein
MIVLKLDFRKAFDLVDCGALDQIMSAYGFSSVVCIILQTGGEGAVVLHNGVPGRWGLR